MKLQVAVISNVLFPGSSITILNSRNKPISAVVNVFLSVLRNSLTTDLYFFVIWRPNGASPDVI